jgi:tetratricopeptide (TPR) repeat protein
MHRHILTTAAVLALAGCTSTSAPPTPPPEAQKPSAATTEPVPRPPATPAEQQQAQKVALRVADLLEAGNETEARSELDRALTLDPNNKLAQNFLRQLTVDPATALGTESFAYTVRPGETLSRIAGRYMNDIYAFYLLARYNDVKVPRLVSAGQTIRVPGKAPPPEPPPVKQPRSEPPKHKSPKSSDKERVVVERDEAEPAPPPPPVQPPPDVVSPAEKAYREGLAAQRSGNRERAYQQFRQAAQLDPGHADARAKTDQLRREIALQHERNARSAFARQDLEGAIRNWDRVLELEPGNDNARLEKQKAQSLKQKIDKVN